MILLKGFQGVIRQGCGYFVGVVLALILFFCLQLNGAIVQAGELTGLGDLPGGVFDSKAYAVSADGSVVVGKADTAGGVGYEAFRWTQSESMVGLGDLSGGLVWSEAYDVSANGSVIVGLSNGGVGMNWLAFRWTQSTGMVSLGELAGGINRSEAWAVSANGSVVVGLSWSANGQEAFRWTQAGGMVGLGDLLGGAFVSYAKGVSADGSVVVGRGESASGNEAFRWTQVGGMVGLGDLPGGGFFSSAYAVSANGDIVVGDSDSVNCTIAGEFEAFRWSQETGMVGLGDLSGGIFSSYASGVSDDGSIIIGQSNSNNGWEAFYWTQASGMRSLADVLADAGVDTSNWDLTKATDVSADGNIVVGYGDNVNGTEAFLANVSIGGLLNLADFNRSIDELHNVPAMLTHVSRNLAQTSLPYQAQGFSLSPVFSYVKGSNAASAGIAGNYSFRKIDVQAKAGATMANDELRYGGETEFNGYWLGLGINTSFGRVTGVEFLNSLEFIVNVNAGKYNADIERQYMNGATVETSEGDTDLESISSLARIGWRQKIGSPFALTPYAQYLHTRVEIDSYTEDKGTFPGTVEEQKDNKTEYSLGLIFDWNVSEKINFFAKGAWVTLNDDTSDAISITVPNTGGGTYVSQGATFDANWLEYGIGTSWKLSEKLGLQGEVGGTNGSEYPETYYGQISININW